MRKFAVRWWVEDPRERYEREIDALNGECGLSLRYLREATPENIRFMVRGWFFNLETGAFAEL